MPGNQENIPYHAVSGWGADVKTLRIAALALSLVYYTAEYCAPIWWRRTHIRFIDSVINEVMCNVTGCLRPTQTDY